MVRFYLLLLPLYHLLLTITYTTTASSSTSSSPLSTLSTIHPPYTNLARRRKRNNPSSTSSFRSNNNADVRYDRSVTTFNPDGNLLQVDYANRASDRGRIISCVSIDVGKDYGGRMAILAVGSSPSSLSSSSSSSSTERKDNESSSSSLHRMNGAITEINNSAIHRIDTNLFLATTGIIGDGTFLARNLRSYALDHYRRSYGEREATIEVGRIGRGDDDDEETSTLTTEIAVAATKKAATMKGAAAWGGPPSPYELSKRCGEIHHRLTLVPGYRPLGVKWLVIGTNGGGDIGSNYGTDSSTDLINKENDGVRLFRGGPGGVLEECECFVGGGNNGNTLKMAPPGNDKLMEIINNAKRRLSLLSKVDDHDEKKKEYDDDDDDENNNNDLNVVLQDLMKGLVKIMLNISPNVKEEATTMRGDNILTENENIKTEMEDEMTLSSSTATTSTTTIANDDGDDTNINERVDLYLFQPNSKHRGGMYVRLAKNVGKDDIDKVSTLLFP